MAVVPHPSEKNMLRSSFKWVCCCTRL